MEEIQGKSILVQVYRGEVIMRVQIYHDSTVTWSTKDHFVLLLLLLSFFIIIIIIIVIIIIIIYNSLLAKAISILFINNYLWWN